MPRELERLLSENFTDHGKPWSGVRRTVSQGIQLFGGSQKTRIRPRYEIIFFNDLRRFTPSRVVFIQPDLTRGP
jgi:hypothetical protein